MALLGGCSAGGPAISSSVVTYVPGIAAGESAPPQSTADQTPNPFAAWASKPRQIYVTTWGSSSCPRLPTSIESDGPRRIHITTSDNVWSDDEGCTADLGPTTSTVTLPKDVADSAPLAVTIDGTTTQLDPQH
jgi:hypothetical protein